MRVSVGSLNRTRQSINLVVLKARVTDPVFLKGYCTYELHPYLEEPWSTFEKPSPAHLWPLLLLLLHVVTNLVPWLEFYRKWEGESETEWDVLTMRQNINTCTKNKASITNCISALLCIRALPLPPISAWEARLQVTLYGTGGQCLSFHLAMKLLDKRQFHSITVMGRWTKSRKQLAEGTTELNSWEYSFSYARLVQLRGREYRGSNWFLSGECRL